jgi:uncharacterized protein YdeI (YjbR/CyaY-like superfamily)
MKKDKRIDAYIEKAQPFARPILKQIRKIVHKGCPEVEETIKWGMPSFEYKGLLCGMAAFKQHAVFGFWKAALMKDAKMLLAENANAMGQFGKMTSVKNLPPEKKFLSLVKEAMKLNEAGVKLPPKPRLKEAKPLAVPSYFKRALASNKKAQNVFEAFSPSKKKDYIEWITEAKTEETREKRMETALEWLAEGKSRNWKYEK